MKIVGKRHQSGRISLNSGQYCHGIRCHNCTLYFMISILQYRIIVQNLPFVKITIFIQYAMERKDNRFFFIRLYRVRCRRSVMFTRPRSVRCDHCTPARFTSPPLFFMVDCRDDDAPGLSRCSSASGCSGPLLTPSFLVSRVPAR
jgi:hypothetical protein